METKASASKSKEARQGNPRLGRLALALAIACLACMALGMLAGCGGGSSSGKAEEPKEAAVPEKTEEQKAAEALEASNAAIIGDGTATAFYDSGVVKTVERTQDGKLAVRETYSESGDPLELVKFNAGGAVVGTKTWNADGTAVMNTTDYDATGAITRTDVQEYDAKGLEVKQTMYNPDGSEACVWIKSYDESGKLIRTDSYIGGKLNSYYTHEYGSNGLVASEDQFYADGSPYSHYVYTYNEGAIQADVMATLADGSFDCHYTATLDKDGNEIARTYYDEAGNVTGTRAA